MRFAKWVFTGAAIYGLVLLSPMYFLEDLAAARAPVNHPINYYGFLGTALAFQVLFWLIGRDPVRLRPAMIAAILEKISFGGAVVALYSYGRGGAEEALIFGLIDLGLAVLFAIAWVKTSPATGSEN